VKRGEIWTLAGGVHDAGKPRPAVILQDNRVGRAVVVFLGVADVDGQ
jgi:mRNA-degrading endonuclease toxin of MazEF toxin-antitoxin module